MSLFDTLFREFTGQKVTAKQRREAEREFKKMAEHIQEALRAQLEQAEPPRIVHAGNMHFVFHRIGEPQPGEWHLCGDPLRMREQTTLRTSPHMCRVYWPIKGPEAHHRASQNAPPHPARPSEADKIHRALKTLGFADPTYSTSTVWPPPPGEIRAAFTAIARKDHPDRNPGDAAAEARYKEASAAYTLLKEHQLV